MISETAKDANVTQVLQLLRMIQILIIQIQIQVVSLAAQITTLLLFLDNQNHYEIH